MSRYILTLFLVAILSACANETDVRESYIVILKENPSLMAQSQKVKAEAVSSDLANLSKSYDIVEKTSFSSVIQGAVYDLNQEELENLKKDSRIAFIEKDHIISIYNLQTDPPWGLDRIDQESSQLDKEYFSPYTGKNVNAYVIDTGVLIEHEDFSGRASHGYDFVDNDSDATDCNGHGTHVAGSIAGTKYGVAKQANIIGLRVLGCGGSGSYSNVIKAVEWVTENHKKPAVANLSLGGPKSEALETAIKNSIESGITYVVAAGNSDRNACSYSPAGLKEAISVGSTTSSDRRSDFSNHGPCVDVFAPGSNILSAWHRSKSSTSTISGTSMAAPHVAGAAALHLEAYPEAKPSEVLQALVDNAVVNQLSDVRGGSPNRLLNIEYLPLPQEEEPYLKIGEQLSALNGLRASEQFYVVKVGAEVKNLTISIHSGSGDADLYVKKGSEPDYFSYDCRPYRWGNEEVCNFKNDGVNTYHIMIRGYEDFSGLSLEIN